VHVPLNKALIGRSVSQELVPVSRENVVAFARALGFEDPVYSDVDEARIAGHPDVVAPPTYAVALSAATAHLILDDPDLGLGLDYSRVVHGEQSVRLHQDIHAGDVLTSTTRLRDIRVAGKHELIDTETTLTRPGGAVACVLRSVSVSRGTAIAGAKS
jgi:N-terminal half of MaoC dehydratase